MSDIEISEPFNAAINSIPALGAKLKSTPADARLTFTGVPQSDANKLKLNLTLAGFVKVEVRGATVVANTPKVFVCSKLKKFNFEKKYQLGTAQSIGSRNLIDPSELLTAKDKTKPDAESLKAPCGPPGAGKKKRACAGCTCGLSKFFRITWFFFKRSIVIHFE